MKSKASVGVLAIAFVSTVGVPSSAALVRTVTEVETSNVQFTVNRRADCGGGRSADIETTIALSGSSETVSGTEGDSSSTRLDITFAEFNGCTGRFMHVLRFIDDRAYVQVGVDTVIIDGAFDLIDSTGPVGVVDIDIEIDGTGTATRDSSTSTSTSGGTRFITISQESTRAGAASGSITLRGVELIGGASEASLTSSSTTRIELSP